MDDVRNPFAPGAGSKPPELSGRDDILANADTALQRTIANRHAKSQILLGLRGTGKTVLLNQIEQMALQQGHQTAYIEAPEDEKLTLLLYPRMQQVLRKWSAIEQSKAIAHSALRALRGFASTFKVKIGDVSIAVDAEPGVADSGLLDMDLTQLFELIGKTAQSANTAWTILIDEVQYLSSEELAAMIVAIHRVNQLGLPILFFGAGLPQLAALTGNAKSYAERLFDFPPVAALDDVAAANAIRHPLEDENESITADALTIIIEKTHGYPYFLQEWGYQVWNVAPDSPINSAHVEKASILALRRLDNGFFRVRLDRLTPGEREYVTAMARLGAGPYRSSEVAGLLGESMQKLGPRRAQIINKGMIYSPARGDIDFTVPMFDDYLRRTFAIDS